MVGKKAMNRSMVILGAVALQVCLGVIYAWSVFTPQLLEAGWSNTQTQAVFACSLAIFAVVMVWAGRVLSRVGPRKLVISGGLILGAGYILAGVFGGTNFSLILVFIGIMGGAGIGLSYVVPIAVCMRWFPDKKGLVTGLAVAGFGFGAMLWVKLAGSWGHVLDIAGISGTFTIYGLMILLISSIAGIVMVFPPKGWAPKSYKQPTKSCSSPGVGVINFTSREMLATPQYYMILIIFAFGASAGLMSIGLMKLFPVQALMTNGMGKLEALAVAGTAMAVFFSLANGIGRVAWGAISDKIGRKNSIIIMLAIQGVMVLLFKFMAGSEYMLYLGATIIGFNFGGNFSLFPLITADIFGTKSVGQNYGWVFLAYGVGGIFGPILGGVLGDMGNFCIAFTICGALCIIAAVITMFLKPPKKKKN